MNQLKILTLDYCRRIEDLNGIDQLDRLEN